ncbi:MAG: metallophosphoesterase [Candidatus Marinimicrobia bacterium]|nr:metallophosphoesterase [Candidatus Neomarinimicrobiota bacterium]
MTKALFVSDLHGRIEWYEKLFRTIRSEPPDVVLLGGDLFPHAFMRSKEYPYFLNDYLRPGFLRLQKSLKEKYPKIMLIMGNDDPKSEETDLLNAGSDGLWDYIHNRKITCFDHIFGGYSFVPPTPFQLKDWEKYDVSRFVDPGCVSPEEGMHTTQTDPTHLRYGTIQKDIARLYEHEKMSKVVCLFHSPPYQTNLDRAALDGQMFDHAPLDVHVGSIAIKRFIEQKQPKITLHGHIHESSRITGQWQEKIGETYLFTAAYEGPELAIIKLDLERPDLAQRLLI